MVCADLMGIVKKIKAAISLKIVIFHFKYYKKNKKILFIFLPRLIK